MLTNQVATQPFSHLCAHKQQMARKKPLNIHAAPPEVMALFTTERVYRVAWKLNELLEIALEAANSEERKEAPNISEEYPLLLFSDLVTEANGFLIGNKNGSSLLYPTKPAADFFLTWQCSGNPQLGQQWMKILKQEPFFQATYLFPAGVLKTNFFEALFH